MAETYTTGTWIPNEGEEEAFVEAWTRFASWASSMPGAGALQLVRDLHEPGRYVSLGAWDSLDEIRAWKGSPEFRERMASVLRHVDEFGPTELELLVTVEAGEATHAAAATTA